MKESNNFQGFLRKKVWRYKKTIEIYFRIEETNFFDLMLKSIFQSIETFLENQNTMTY